MKILRTPCVSDGFCAFSYGMKPTTSSKHEIHTVRRAHFARKLVLKAGLGSLTVCTAVFGKLSPYRPDMNFRKLRFFW